MVDLIKGHVFVTRGRIYPNFLALKKSDGNLS